MSDLNEESMKHLGRLCRLDLADEALPQLFKNLKSVLDYVDLLQEVDVSHIAPYAHVEEQGIGSLREDKVERLLNREEFLSNAPAHIGGMIRVPPVIKQP
jgi:aspartyl-tRNA(Asn)/glutamyl-tRNA(Gln) amidotransferase subunit C